MCIRDRMYSGFPQQTLRTFKMRGRQSKCLTCGDHPTINKEAIQSGSINYELFCGSRNYNVCEPDERMSVQDFEKHREGPNDVILLDVRPSHHYEISHFANTFNIPVKKLRNMDGSMAKLQDEIPRIKQDSEVVVLCRYGNDSQIATRLLKDEFKIPNVRDVKGGFFKYIDEIDPSIPKY